MKPSKQSRKPRYLFLSVFIAVFLIGLVFHAFDNGSGGTGPGATHPASAADLSGTIEFGYGYTSDLRITAKTNTFRPGAPFAWVAHLNDSANSTKLTLSISRVQGGVETSLWSDDDVRVSDTDADTLANKHVTLADLGVTRPGTYIMRYYRPDGTKLAKGRFTLTDRPETQRKYRVRTLIQPLSHLGEFNRYTSKVSCAVSGVGIGPSNHLTSLKVSPDCLGADRTFGFPSRSQLYCLGEWSITATVPLPPWVRSFSAGCARTRGTRHGSSG